MTIRGKLLIAALGTVVTVILMGGLFLFTRRLEDHTRKKAVRAAARLEDLKTLAQDVERQMARVDFFLITGETREKEEFEALERSSRRLMQERAIAIPWLGSYEALLAVGRSIFAGGRLRRASRST